MAKGPKLRERLTYANVMATLGVFVALGGVSYAAVSLPKNSVGSRELKPNAVKTGYLAKNAVRTGKIAPEAVRAGKLAEDAVVTNRLRDTAVTSDKIANGAINAAKLGSVTVQTEKASVGANSIGSANVECPAGQRAISGGGSWDTYNKELSFLATRPIRSIADLGQMADGESAGGWRASGYNDSAVPDSILVWVLCLE